VRVPTSGAIELRIRDRDTLDLMTGTVAALPVSSGFAVFKIESTIDGQREPAATLSMSGPVLLRHPRPHHELRYRIGPLGGRLAQPADVCLQLSPRAVR
jgi:hypothetical protein